MHLEDKAAYTHDKGSSESSLAASLHLQAVQMQCELIFAISEQCDGAWWASTLLWQCACQPAAIGAMAQWRAASHRCRRHHQICWYKRSQLLSSESCHLHPTKAGLPAALAAALHLVPPLQPDKGNAHLVMTLLRRRVIGAAGGALAAAAVLLPGSTAGSAVAAPAVMGGCLRRVSACRWSTGAKHTHRPSGCACCSSATSCRHQSIN